MSAGYDLYVITDEALSNGLSHFEIAQRAIAGGADVIQLRDKVRTSRQLLPIAKEICAYAKAAGATFIVNDRIEIALASRADGVHIGQDDLPLRDARAIAPPGFVIGVSVSSFEQAMDAEKDGADYIALGPIFATKSKLDAAMECGIEMLERVGSALKIPLIAIGGINSTNVSQVIELGADGVAVISAVVSQPNITESARELKDLIVKVKSSRDSTRRKY